MDKIKEAEALWVIGAMALFTFLVVIAAVGTVVEAVFGLLF